jgi:SAM-dependent methyltransferase
MGNAGVQGALWGRRARDWAELQEPAFRPLYTKALHELGVGHGKNLLDCGCGAGLFCRLAAGLGAQVSGIDAAEPLVAIARSRLPGADFRVGDMEELPYADEMFDMVTGFNSFQFASDPAAALREAGRVARPGGKVSVAAWGRPEDCAVAAIVRALGSFLPPPPAGTPGPFALAEPGALETFARQANLAPGDPIDVDVPFVYRDLDHALGAILSWGPAVRSAQEAGEQPLRAAVTEALQPFRQPDATYDLQNTLCFMVATA